MIFRFYKEILSVYLPTIRNSDLFFNAFQDNHFAFSPIKHKNTHCLYAYQAEGDVENYLRMSKLQHRL